MAITLTLITALKLFTDATGTGVFDQWYWRLGIAAVVNTAIATSYTLWPKQPPAGATVEDGRIVEDVPERAKH